MPGRKQPQDDPFLLGAHECLASTKIAAGPSEQLIRQVQASLQSAAARQENDPGPQLTPSTWVIPCAAAAVFIAIAIGALSYWTFFETDNVFAETARQFKTLSSATYRITTAVDDKPKETTRYFLSGRAHCRAEFSTGNVIVLNTERGEFVTLIPAEKKLVIEQAYELRETFDFLGELQKLARKTTKPLPERDIGGIKAPGFLLKEEHRETRAWIDPDRKLPIWYETHWKDDQGQMTTEIYDRFVYNQHLDESLFVIDAPDGYLTVDNRPDKLDEEQRKEDLGALEIKPLEGIGPIRFGMSKDEVIELIGLPDATKVWKPRDHLAYERRLKDPKFAVQHDSLRKRIEKIKQSEHLRVGVETLKYNSSGFEVRLLPSVGVIGFTCNTQEAQGFRVRDFKGQTKEGLGMLASRKTIEEVYGKPDDSHGVYEYDHMLLYGRLGLTFQLKNDRLIILILRKPGLGDFG